MPLACLAIRRGYSEEKGYIPLDQGYLLPGRTKSVRHDFRIDAV